MGHISSSANNVKSRHVRAMDIDDIPAVRALFKLVFRPHSKSCNENFDRYFQRLFFENAYYDPAIGSIVHENDHGEIDSVVAALPIPYIVNGQSIVGRLLCAYMMKPGGSPRGAAELTLNLRPSEKIFSFSDSAAPVSLRHFEAIGGVTLGAHGLGWTRIFKTGSYVTKYVANRLPFLGGLASNAVGKILNPLFPVSQAAKSRATVKEIAQDEAISLIPVLLKSYSAYPAWTEGDFSWLLGMAMENRAAGALRLFAIDDSTGSPTGFFCYYRRPDGIAQVLSVIAKSGTEI